LFAVQVPRSLEQLGEAQAEDGAHTEPPPVRAAQQPLLQSESEVHATAHMDPSELFVLTQ